MYTITKTFEFSASHSLTHLPENHPCHRLHGHNYVLKVELKSEELDPKTKMVKDYRELAKIKNYVDKYLDHKNLNDVFPFPTTSENMAKWLFEIFKEWYPQLSAVELSETPKTNCRYES